MREGEKTVASKSKSDDGPITIKKYANRRLYNTATSQYVTLDHLAQMVKAGTEFKVVDAKSGEDITRSVLTQIIFEEEGKGQNLLPIQFLRQLIRFYGDQMQAAVPRYLEVSMENFARAQEEMRERMSEAFGGSQPFKIFEEMARQNAVLFQETWQEAYRRMMPFGASPGEGEGLANGAEPVKSETGGEELAALRAQVQALEEKLDKISTAEPAGGEKPSESGARPKPS